MSAATVLAIATPAASLVTLDIADPAPPAVGNPEAQRPTAALVATEPVKPDVNEVPVPDVASPAHQGLVARSAPVPVLGYATVGVTWQPGEVVQDEDISVWVRSLADGAWTEWETVEYHDDHGPDPQSDEGSTVRPGTDPIVVGDVDQVQVKAVTVAGEAPDDITMAVIDPGNPTTAALEQPAIDTASSGSAGAAEADASLASADTTLSVASVAKPKIFSRAQWGADERMRDPGSLHYGTIRAGFVHHTVNANGYTADQVPSLIRGIYAYHTQSRGWSDVGYNFIVDRFGRIWEGRYGGVSRPVVGAHTLGYNEYSFAMSALGNFDTAPAPGAMLEAYGRLFAWKLSLHGVKAESTSQRLGYRTFKAINGHRDAAATACPGRYLYAKLPTIRTLAAKYQTGSPPPPPPLPPPPPGNTERSADISGSKWPDLVVRDKSSKRAFVVETGGQVAFAPGESADRRWDEMDLVVGSRDLTGDRIADMVARKLDTKATSVYPGDGSGGFGAPAVTTTKFSGADQLLDVRDFDGDGRNDLVSRDAASKALYLHPGNGEGNFFKKRLLASSWNYELTVGVGDLDGDGNTDLAARDRTGSLKLFSGTGARLAGPTTLADSWDVFDLVVGPGDLTNDGKADILARNATSGLTYIYPGTGQGRLRSRLGPFAEFEEMDVLTSPGQVSGNKRTDLVGRTASGQLVYFTNKGRKNITAITDSGSAVGTADLLVNVGDWNDDGHGDLMTRSGRSGRIYLRRGNGEGQFAKPVLADTNWGSIGSVSAVGDVTGDGHVDLVGLPNGGEMRTYPGDGRSGFLSSRLADPKVVARLSAGSPDRYDWMLNVGDANGDKLPDLIAREKATGELWLMPGTETGFANRRFISEGFSSYDLGG